MSTLSNETIGQIGERTVSVPNMALNSLPQLQPLNTRLPNRPLPLSSLSLAAGKSTNMNTSNPQETLKPALKSASITKKVSYTFLTVFMLILLSLLLLPSITKQLLINRLLDAGADRVEINQVRFNQRGIQILGIAIYHNKQNILHAQRITLEPVWQSLNDERININRLDLHGGFIQLRKNTQGNWGLPGFSSSKDDAENSQPIPIVGINRLYISESRIHLQQGKTSPVIQLKSLDMKNFHPWKPEQDSAFSMTLYAAGGELKLRGISRPFADQGSVAGAFSVDGVDIGLLQKWLDAPHDQRINAYAKIANDFSASWYKDPTSGDIKDINITGTTNTQISKGAFKNAQLELQLKGIDLHAQYIISDDAIELDGNLDLNQFKAHILKDNNARISAPNTQWHGQLSYNRHSNALALNGQLKFLNVAVQQKDRSLQLSKASWKGKIATTGQNISTQNTLNLKGLSLKQGDDAMSLNTLSWIGDLSRHQHYLNSQQSLIKATQLNIKQAKQHLQLDALNWKGASQFGLKQQDTTQSGRLELSGLLMDPQHSTGQQRIRQQYLLWQGRYQRSSNGRAEIKGTLLGKQTELTQQDKSLELAHFALTQVDIQQDGDQASGSINEVTIQGASALAPDQNIKLNTLTLQQLNFGLPATVSIQASHIRGLDARLSMASAAADTGKSSSAKADNNAKNTSNQTKGAKPTVNARPIEQPRLFEGINMFLGKIILEQSRIELTDSSLKPPFVSKLNNLFIELDQVDSKTPENTSKITLHADIGEFGKLNIDGDFQVLQPTVQSQFNAKIRALNLLDLNPYLRAQLNDEVQSGSLNIDTHFSITAGILKVDNDLTIHHMELAANASEKEAGSSGSILDSALNLLQDSSGTIKMKLPISGRFDSPDFDISDAINQAMSKSVATGVLLYLQPIGALVAVGKLVHDEFNTLRFNPVSFAPSSSKLNSTNRQYLDDLATRLNDRPGIHIKVCGVAVKADRDALLKNIQSAKGGQQQTNTKPSETLVSDKQLIAMASQRASNVRHYLINQTSLSTDHLIDCAARFDRDDSALPEVRMGQ